MTQKEVETLHEIVKEPKTSEAEWQRQQKEDEKKMRAANRRRVNYAMRLCCASYPAQLVAGLRVPIYERPVTGEGFEGIVLLFERKKHDEDEPVSAYTHMEYWIVRFVNESDMCLRSIHVRNEEPSDDETGSAEACDVPPAG